MKLIIERETLLKPLQLVIGVVERKQALPILSNVLLSTKGNTLSITGTDLEIELISQVNIAIPADEPSQITVPGKKLMDICKALPDGASIELKQNKEKIILSSGKSRFTLSTLPAQDFPNLENDENQIEFTLTQKELRYLLQRTHFAIAQQDVRYYLNGLLLEITKNSLRAIATDGHRLAMSHLNANIPTDQKHQIIVPRKATIELMRLLEDEDSIIKIAIAKGHICVSTANCVFTSKLIEGRFPGYEHVIPKDGDKKISIDRDVLKQALHRAAIFCNEKFRAIRFELQKNLLKLHANNPEQEAAEEEISIDYLDEDVEIAFNVNYLLDILNTVPGGEVQFTLSDANSSILVETLSGEDNCLYVVMPMRM